ncbi:MAG TPA: SpoIIE family protein phosphatase [Firmicutes bacterium]|nr:SpoIIE family protein phosphatase [Bacillota bacterium]
MDKTGTGKEVYYFPSWKKRITGNWFSHLASGQAGISINWQTIILFIITFFIARASLLGEVASFGFIFWALMMRAFPEKKFLVTGAVLLGWATLPCGLFPPWFLPAAMLSWQTVDFLLEKLFKRHLALFLALPLIIFALRFPLLLAADFPLYETTVVVLEMVPAVFIPPLVRPLLEETKIGGGQDELSSEGAIGVLLLLILVFLGMDGIVLFGSIRLLNILPPFLVLLGAYLWGPVLGMLGGMVAGLTLSFNNPALLYYAGVLGVSGFLAGLLKPYGRFWLSISYLLILRFFSFFGIEGGYPLTGIGEELIVVALFLLIPITFWSGMQEISILFPWKLDNGGALRYKTASRIKEFAEVFGELAMTFQPINREEAAVSQRDFTPLVEYFSRNVCKACGYYLRCWKGDADKQGSRVIAMLATMEEKGYFTEKMIPAKLKRYCPRQAEIAKTVGKMKEIHRLNCYWQEKVRCGRMMVSEQLQGVSLMMHDLLQELKTKVGYQAEVEKNKKVCFSLEVGIAQVAREGYHISGDSYAVLPMKEGKQALLLSDGMGSGKQARQASRSAVRLMERLLEAGFQQEIVISTINTLLRLRYPAERFATMDLALLDLAQGEIELYKLGAPPSFFKNGASVRVLGTGSLPMGILEEIAPERETCSLNGEGATFVMITDGLWEDRGGEENWLVTALKGIRHDHPQIIADRLIEEGCNRFPGGVKDDLTVLVGSVRSLGKKRKTFK